MNSMQPSQTDVWQNFFTGFKQYARETESPPIPVVNANDAEQFFSQFREQYAPFVRSGGAINVWNVAGIDTDEVRNCAVLHWLLDCHGSHGQKTTFLHWFLEAIQSRAELSDACREHFPRAVDADAPYRTISEGVYEQVGPDGVIVNSRIDIVIESDTFLLFIEAKVHAGESGNQLERYADILCSRKTGKRSYGMVFLTPDGRAARDKSVKDVACLSWKQLADVYEECISNDTAAPQSPFLMQLVQQFCHHIRTF